MENTPSSDSGSSTKMLVGIFWLVSLFAVGVGGYILGQNAKQPETSNGKEVLSQMNSVQDTPTPMATATPAIDSTSTCSKAGLAQKWEYLTPYVLKEGDNLQAIVLSELKDESRVNEVVQLNQGSQLVAGSTLYLPPKSVTKSTGHLQLVQGKLIEKNPSSWYVSFGGDEKGRGILIPSFWFGEIKDESSYKVGECVSILLDDGFKVFTVANQ